MVILELIHAKNPDFGRGVFIRLKTNALRGSLVIHDNLSNRMALRRRWFIQISALSTFDGWVRARPRRRSMRIGFYIQGRQQARKLHNGNSPM